MKAHTIVFLVLCLVVFAGFPVLAQESFFQLVQTGTPEEVRQAIAAGADVLARDKDNISPLMWAAAKNPDPAVITVLMAAGAELEARYDREQTPLMLAARWNPNPEIVKALLEAGAWAQYHAQGGWTALALLIQNQDLVGTEAQTLLEEASGELFASYGFVRGKGFTFFELCESGTPEEVQEALATGSSVHAGGTRDYQRPLLSAFQNPDPKVVKILLDAGADVNWHCPFSGKTLLMYAAEHGSDPVVIQLLLEAGADLESAYHDINPLMYAAQFSPDHTVIQLLLDAGAEVNDRSDNGRTPLIWAAGYNQNPEVIWTLLAAGAELEARDEGGRTPLIWAAGYNQNPEVIWMLLDAGAEVKARDSDGKTAFDYAQENEHIQGTDVYHILSEALL